MNKPDTVEGYQLFHNIKDKELQRLNRATVLANIIEDNLYKEGVVTQGGMYLSLKYWDAIPEGEERDAIYKLVRKEVDKRGLIPNGL